MAMPNLYYVFLFYACILIYLAAYTYYRRKDWIARCFILFNGSLAIWNLCIYLLEEYLFTVPINLISQIQLTSALIYINALYYFCYLYPQPDKPIKYRLNGLIFLVLLFAIFFTDFVSQAVIENNKLRFIDGYGYILYGVYFITLYVMALSHIIKAYNKYPRYRINIFYLLLGMGLFLTFAILFNLILPVFGIYEFIVYGHLGTIFVPLFFTYAITKHNLLDITVSIKRNTAWVLTGILMVVSFALVYHHTDHGSLHIVAITLLGLFWARYAHPLQNFCVTTVRRKFVRGWYDPEAIFTQLSENLATEQDRQTIFITIVKALDEIFQLENIDVIIAIRGNDNKLSHYELYEKEFHVAKQTLPLEHPVIEYMRQKNDVGFLSQYPPEIQEFLIAQNYPHLEKCLALPFSSPDMLEGVIIMGERSIGMPFNDNDMRFFKRLINYVAAVLYRLTPFEILEQQYFAAKQELHEAEIQLIRAKKIEAIAHATRQCHHEIRTPLSIINMGANRVKNLADLEKYKNIVREEISNALEIIDETLAITDIAGIPAKTKSWINVNDAIRRCFKLIPETGYRLYHDLHSLPKTLGNQNDLEVVFTNLMNNAKDAMPDGGTLTIKSFKEKEQIVVTFTDTGKGIPDELKQSVWEPYTSGHRTTEGNTTAGRGWGMTIIQRIITEHGGTISFNSNVGVGTSFIIRLPLA